MCIDILDNVDWNIISIVLFCLWVRIIIYYKYRPVYNLFTRIQKITSSNLTLMKRKSMRCWVDIFYICIEVNWVSHWSVTKPRYIMLILRTTRYCGGNSLPAIFHNNSSVDTIQFLNDKMEIIMEELKNKRLIMTIAENTKLWYF